MAAPPHAFSDLAAALCAAAGTSLPPLVPDTQGGLGLRMEIEGVSVSLTHHATQFPEHAFVLVVFGAVSAHAEADVFRELLEANLMMLRPGAPAFSRDPVDGQIVLQACCTLEDTSADELLAGIRVAVGSAHEWRRTHRLVPLAGGTGHPFGTAFA